MIIFESIIADFRTRQRTFVHVFKGRNSNPFQIRVLNKKGSCGCLSVDIDTLIEPNQNFDVVCKIVKDEAFRGFFAVDVKIEFSVNGKSEWITLAITGEIVD